jgi:hypothetical protein
MTVGDGLALKGGVAVCVGLGVVAGVGVGVGTGLGLGVLDAAGVGVGAGVTAGVGTGVATMEGGATGVIAGDWLVHAATSTIRRGESRRGSGRNEVSDTSFRASRAGLPVRRRGRITLH